MSVKLRLFKRIPFSFLLLGLVGGALGVIAAHASHYDTMGLSPTVSQAEIAARFRFLSLRRHPDQAANVAQAQGLPASQIPALRARLEQEFVQIKEAYDVLRDPFRRASYDLSLGRPRTRVPAPAPPPVSRPAAPPTANPAPVSARQEAFRRRAALPLTENGFGFSADEAQAFATTAEGMRSPDDYVERFRIALDYCLSGLDRGGPGLALPPAHDCAFQLANAYPNRAELRAFVERVGRALSFVKDGFALSGLEARQQAVDLAKSQRDMDGFLAKLREALPFVTQAESLGGLGLRGAEARAQAIDFAKRFSTAADLNDHISRLRLSFSALNCGPDYARLK